ncbi:MAG: HEPN domain-containing protein [Desulfovibrionaceae bacterium]|nr:HEPN domain-containing protein [Desulfovibrionaceae bacterium]
MKASEIQEKYISWQNAAFDFYVSARLLIQQEILRAATFCSFQAIECLIKATLIYHVDGFEPKEFGHDLDRLQKELNKNVDSAKYFKIPDYFCYNKIYQQTSRYPDKIFMVILDTLLEDTDRLFYELINLVPPRFETQLVAVLRNRECNLYKILSHENIHMSSYEDRYSALLTRGSHDEGL